MKGTIFVELLNVVETAHGIEAVDAVITEAGDALSTSGAYTGVGNYPHQELLALVAAASKLTHASVNDLLETFAGHLIGVFEQMHPEFFERATDYLSFLESVQSHVHVEVLKLYPEAAPPHLLAERTAPDTVRLSYRSHRPLAAFAAALARQSASAFDTTVDVTMENQSADGCEAEISVRVLQ